MNWLDWIIMLCIATGLIKGLLDGFVKQAIALVALLAAVFFTGQIAIPVRNFLLLHLVGETVPLPVWSAFCYIIVFACIILIIVLFGKIVDVAIKMTPAKPLNILLGGLFGMFIWILSLSILFNLFAVFDSASVVISKPIQEKSRFYHRVKEVTPTIFPDWKKLTLHN